MASAPRPGVAKRKEAAKVAQSILVVPYDDQELRLAWQNLPMGERVACRKATGLPFETFTTAFEDTRAEVVGEDSLCVAWWLARRRNGEPNLSWTAAMAEWDASKLGAIRVEDDAEKATGDDPEV